MRKKPLTDLKQQLTLLLEAAQQDDDAWVVCVVSLMKIYVSDRCLSYDFEEDDNGLFVAYKDIVEQLSKSSTALLPLEQQYLDISDEAQPMKPAKNPHFTVRGPTKADKLRDFLNAAVEKASQRSLQRRKPSMTANPNRERKIGGGVGLPRNSMFSQLNNSSHSRPNSSGSNALARRSSAATLHNTGKKYVVNKKSAVMLDNSESLNLVATSVKRKKTEQELVAEEQERVRKRLAKQRLLEEEKERKVKVKEQKRLERQKSIERKAEEASALAKIEVENKKREKAETERAAKEKLRGKERERAAETEAAAVAKEKKENQKKKLKNTVEGDADAGSGRNKKDTGEKGVKDGRKSRKMSTSRVHPAEGTAGDSASKKATPKKPKKDKERRASGGHEVVPTNTATKAVVAQDGRGGTKQQQAQVAPPSQQSLEGTPGAVADADMGSMDLGIDGVDLGVEVDVNGPMGHGGMQSTELARTASGYETWPPPAPPMPVVSANGHGPDAHVLAAQHSTVAGVGGVYPAQLASPQRQQQQQVQQQQQQRQKVMHRQQQQQQPPPQRLKPQQTQPQLQQKQHTQPPQPQQLQQQRTQPPQPQLQQKQHTQPPQPQQLQQQHSQQQLQSEKQQQQHPQLSPGPSQQLVPNYRNSVQYNGEQPPPPPTQVHEQQMAMLAQEADYQKEGAKIAGQLREVQRRMNSGNLTQAEYAKDTSVFQFLSGRVQLVRSELMRIQSFLDAQRQAQYSQQQKLSQKYSQPSDPQFAPPPPAQQHQQQQAVQPGRLHQTPTHPLQQQPHLPQPQQQPISHIQQQQHLQRQHTQPQHPQQLRQQPTQPQMQQQFNIHGGQYGYEAPPSHRMSQQQQQHYDQQQYQQQQQQQQLLQQQQQQQLHQQQQHQQQQHDQERSDNQATLDGILVQTNRLQKNDRDRISRFVTGDMRNPNPEIGSKVSVVMNEEQVAYNDHMFLEQIVFEMDYESESWKRLKRKRKL
ncbi:hypothetical protein SARC_08793 [Sphaeroforma arctica JP610]|uniref:Uncharacterized protein n=1 Tax=Sphaeroforma arctica JP610 TaxID=667725 RepID=A0A0L0FS31_9EUKA|nr:hypothetical protein SARC_08793 [Sphaeroforma arctica JP610]KNC78778.1 hypothetical protein SARC_08793 [Sphaeroforma arctica JP610]|eukprot:XP_014152680.1 hypothetical protein SARC_08793 [Sphaeroforma arctica JP610]